MGRIEMSKEDIHSTYATMREADVYALRRMVKKLNDCIKGLKHENKRLREQLKGTDT